MRTFSLILKGMCIGGTDIVPGVSGGTMALMLGLYRQLIHSLHEIGQLNFSFFILLFRKDKQAHSLFQFLWPLGLGILMGIWLMAQALHNLLNQYPSLIYAFFCGLIFSTVVHLFKMTGTRQLPYWVLGYVFGFAITLLSDFSIPDEFLFVAGFLAISAMLLPGISGAFILLILGQYERVLAAVHTFYQLESMLVLLQLFLGILAGLLVLPKILTFLFQKFSKPTFALLGGLMLGSLNKIWPFSMEHLNLADNAGILGLLLVGLAVGWLMQRIA